ncbi:hypothetical protein SAMN05216289_11522 [Dokdonella immobilis]|uniref:Uncharacterized protein n=1 Tax=Dokdonella immobilis TaxID=578942 RepID=A0A1I4Y5I7_9GAMM|nr:hypothetical protein SAMN05216289_11522 [Dokdonella immobilis]
MQPSPGEPVALNRAQRNDRAQGPAVVDLRIALGETVLPAHDLLERPPYTRTFRSPDTC